MTQQYSYLFTSTLSSHQPVEKIEINFLSVYRWNLLETGPEDKDVRLKFSFDNKIDSKDIVFGKAIIDKASLDIISGSTIDFKKEMIGESFVINNPKASSSCGCGLSFSV